MFFPIPIKKILKKINAWIWHPLGLRLTLLRTVRREIVAFNYDFSHEALSYIDQIKPWTMVKHQGLITLYQQIRYIEKNQLPGDFVECGVWKGGSAGLMCLAQLNLSSVRRKIHLFDSFEGLPRALKEKDGEKAVGWLGVQKGCSPEPSYELKITKDIPRHLIVQKIGYPEDCIFFHQGWFQDTVPMAKKKGFIKNIALLRLDGDLYHSTKVCLENLWDLVVPNGIIIVDDYIHFEGCKKAVDEFLDTLPFKPLLNHVGTSGIRYMIKPA